MSDMDATERHRLCVHAEACERQHRRRRPVYGRVADALGCGTCPAYDDQWCPLSLAGTMRCERLKKDRK